MDHVHTQQFAYSSISHCSSHQTLITRHVRAKETVESAGQKMVAVLCQSDWSTANQCVSHLFVVSLVKRTHIALVADTTDGKEWFLCFVFLLWKIDTSPSKQMIWEEKGMQTSGRRPTYPSSTIGPCNGHIWHTIHRWRGGTIWRIKNRTGKLRRITWNTRCYAPENK